MDFLRKTIFLFILVLTFQVFYSCRNNINTSKDALSAVDTQKSKQNLDTLEYNKRRNALCAKDTLGLWPVKNVPYPLAGAILPFHRIVAYYGNLYSKRMGALGEFPKAEMLQKLAVQAAAWAKADSTTPVIPALHYIAMTAQQAPGADKKYRMKMPFDQIDTIVKWTKEINGLTFIDIQIGASTVQEEIPKYAEYFKNPTLHLGIDPEFSMKYGNRPGTVIGTLNSDDINFVIDFLADVVRKNNLPPKILVIHRFTDDMVTGYDKIKNVPEVQVVMHMDGWGGKPLKKETYRRCIVTQPVNWTGFKIFYGNDTKKDKNALLSPEEVLALNPQPIYIQYQ